MQITAKLEGPLGSERTAVNVWKHCAYCSQLLPHNASYRVGRDIDCLHARTSE